MVVGDRRGKSVNEAVKVRGLPVVVVVVVVVGQGNEGGGGDEGKKGVSATVAAVGTSLVETCRAMYNPAIQVLHLL